MLPKVYSIDSFPDNDLLLRVEWFGGISYNPSVPSEPLIEVMLASIPEGEIDPLSKVSRLSTQKDKVEIGVGLLPYVSLGSVWRNKRPVSVQLDRHVRDFQINTSRVNIISVEEAFRIYRAIPPSHYLFGWSTWSIVKDTKVALVPQGDDPLGIIIPVAELMRFYYAPSTRLAQALFWGEYSSSFNNEKSGYIANDVYRLHLRYWMEDHDAWILARFKESQQMQAYVSGLYFALQKHRVMSKQSSVEPFRKYRCWFPFQGESNIQALCVPFPGRDRNRGRFLVLRLLRCSAPFPFETLVADRDNNNLKGETTNDEFLPIAWKARMDREREEVEKDEDRNKFFSDEEPTKALTPLRLDLFESRFADLDGKELIKEEKEVQQYRSMALTKGETKLHEGFGTGHGVWGKSTLKPATVNVRKPEDTPSQAKQSIPATLENFMAAILLYRDETEYPVRFLSKLSSIVEYSESPACLSFPTYDPITRKQIKWACVPGVDDLRPREIAIANISVSGRHCYVLEIERTNKGFAVLFMAKQDQTEIPAFDWSAFLLDCSNKTRWLTEEEMSEYRRDRTTHYGLTSTRVLASRIKEKVNKILATIPGSVESTNSVSEPTLVSSTKLDI